MKQILILIFSLLFISCSNQNSFEKSRTIGILPFGTMSNQEVDSVKNTLASMYGKKVVVLPNQPLPKMAYTTIRYPRYRADSLLRYLSTIRQDGIDIVLGLTNQDISITKYQDGTRNIKAPEWKYKDFGIFGLGQVGGHVCVVSSNRLHKNVSDKLFYERLNRIAAHEIGHVMGLKHCPQKKCLMNDANESIRTIDKSTGKLCEKCWIDLN